MTEADEVEDGGGEARLTLTEELTGGKVKLDLYYEVLCPDSRYFSSHSRYSYKEYAFILSLPFL